MAEHGPRLCCPHLLPLALNKEMDGSSAKEGGSSLEKGTVKMTPGCYSGAAALGKQISSESEMLDVREARQVVFLILPQKSGTHKHNVQHTCASMRS